MIWLLDADDSGRVVIEAKRWVFGVMEEGMGKNKMEQTESKSDLNYRVAKGKKSLKNFSQADDKRGIQMDKPSLVRFLNSSPGL